MKEQSFLFYQRWREQMKRLPDNERLQIYDAICDYAFENKESNLAYYLESILDNIRLTINENRAKQEAFIKLQKEKGRKSAESRKKKNLTAVNIGSTETTNNKNKNKKENNISSSEEEAMSAETADPETESDGKILIVKSDEEKEDREYCNKVAKYFNEQMQGKQVKQIMKLSQKRKSHIIARTKEFGKQAVAIVIQKTAASKFLNGDNSRGFLASFDWIFRPNNFTKIYEGNYDDRTSLQHQQYTASTSAREQRDAEWNAYAAQKLYGADNESKTLPRMLRDSGVSDV
jgi:hypothetical protein|nr:MAG TPA: hypothetical protein [Caudoviricetes sp.]